MTLQQLCLQALERRLTAYYHHPTQAYLNIQVNVSLTGKTFGKDSLFYLDVAQERMVLHTFVGKSPAHVLQEAWKAYDDSA